MPKGGLLSIWLSLLLDFCGGKLLMLLSEKPQYRNDRVDVSDPYQDPSSGHDHFDTVVSPTTTSITNHHRNLATEGKV